MSNRYRITSPWTGSPRRYLNQVGELVNTRKAALESQYDLLTLKMADGTIQTVSRAETTEIEETGRFLVSDEGPEPERLKQYHDKVGELVRVHPARRDPRCDILMLKMPDGQEVPFFRTEIKKLAEAEDGA